MIPKEYLTRICLSVTMLAVIACTSCNKDMTIEQESQIASSSMWKTEADATAAVNGLYVKLRDALSSNIAYWGDYRSGLYGPGKIVDAGLNNIFTNKLVRDNTGTEWSGMYTTINVANLILKHVPDIPFAAEGKKNLVLANAHFVRAYCYFQIARVWGDAPVLTSGFESDKQADLYPGREPAATVFQQVENDINAASEMVTASAVEKYTASYASINMLKADYYLWKAKMSAGGTAALDEAGKALDKVLAAGYSLVDDFGSLFNVANKTNAEIIFSLHFRRDEYTGGYASQYLIPAQYVVDKTLIETKIKTGSSQQYVSVTDAFEQFIYEDPADTRAAVSVKFYAEGSERHRWINKMVGEWISNTRYFSSDIVVYRLAEAYLMKAEIENERGNTDIAISWLNKVSARAYKVDDYYADGLPVNEVHAKIVDETLKEFVAEGKSWWVLLRQGEAFNRIASLQGQENKTNILLWPVTSAAINSNPKIIQTKGYN